MKTSLQRWVIVIVIATFAMVFIPTSGASDRAPAPLPMPTPAELGVPIYPGAKYDAVNSAGYSMNEHHMWLFTTADPVESVVAFYKAKTGRAPERTEGGYNLFRLKEGTGTGAMYFPDHGVMVEPNRAMPPPAKTVITVIKIKQSPGEATTEE